MTNETDDKGEASKHPAPSGGPLLCWAKLSNSHGMVLRDTMFLPIGEAPEVDRDKWQRVPWMDHPAAQAMMDAARDRVVEAAKRILEASAGEEPWGLLQDSVAALEQFEGVEL